MGTWGFVWVQVLKSLCSRETSPFVLLCDRDKGPAHSQLIQTHASFITQFRFRPEDSWKTLSVLVSVGKCGLISFCSSISSCCSSWGLWPLTSGFCLRKDFCIWRSTVGHEEVTWLRWTEWHWVVNVNSFISTQTANARAESTLSQSVIKPWTSVQTFWFWTRMDGIYSKCLRSCCKLTDDNQGETFLSQNDSFSAKKRSVVHPPHPPHRPPHPFLSFHAFSLAPWKRGVVSL